MAAASVLRLLDRLFERRRARYIATYCFPDHHWQKALELLPGLCDEHRPDVEAGLRQFFLIALHARRRAVGMPSDAVDALWHSMILHTREYRSFCRRAFGRFIEHEPNGVPGKTGLAARAELWRSWIIGCRLDGIDAVKPMRLPRLFAVDAALLESSGWHYRLEQGRVVFRRGAADPDQDAEVLYPENADRYGWVTAESFGHMQ